MSSYEPNPAAGQQQPSPTEPPYPGAQSAPSAPHYAGDPAGQAPQAAWTPPPGAPVAPPRKPRPSAWWFLGPAALMAAAGVVFVAALALGLGSLPTSATTVPADGQPHEVTLKNTQEQMLGIDTGGMWEPTCSVADASGTQLQVREPTGTITINSWNLTQTFQPTSRQVVITCATAAGAPGEVGPAEDVVVMQNPDVARTVGSILVAILVPMGLAAVATMWAIVLAILMAVRGPRRTTA